MTPSPSLFRTLARRAAALLPRSALARIAAYRFGHTTEGRRFTFETVEGVRGPAVAIDGRIRLNVTREFMPDVRFHFVENGASRDEIGAFIDRSAGLPADAMLYDVGAHRGLFSLVHCALAPNHRAVLFEPSSTLAADATRLLSLNGFDGRATMRRCGAGARVEMRRIAEDALGFAREAEEGDEVEFTTLDAEWRRTGSAPAIVKIDVEGAEAEVIRGASELLRSVRPLLFLELHLDELERRGDSAAALLQSLAAFGYRFAEPNGAVHSPSSLARSLRAIVRVLATPQ